VHYGNRIRKENIPAILITKRFLPKYSTDELTVSWQNGKFISTVSMA